jgi:GDPmannose 4,6-dehydratase
MPTALITGVSGQDGSYLAERLHDEGWDVHALVRREAVESEQEIGDWVVGHVGDLLDPDSLTAAVEASEPDCIFNLAGASSVAFSWEKPLLTAKATGLAVGVLLEAAWSLQKSRGTEVRFVQASSAEVFGAARQDPQDENTPIRPVTPYGAAKAYGHHLVGVYRGAGMFAASCIFYNHESPRRPTTFVTRKITEGVARIAAGRATELVLGNLDARRDWGWAPDYMHAMARVATAEKADDFVIATGEARSVREFVAAAFAAVDIEDWARFVRMDDRFNRPVDAPMMRGDSSKARKVLGWAPTVSFDELVAAMVRHDLKLLAD